MEQRTRIYYSDPRKALMWDRWQKGDSQNLDMRYPTPINNKTGRMHHGNTDT